MNLKPIAYSAVLTMVLAGGGLAPGQNTPPGPTDYGRFTRFVAERNIFNPDRYPHTSSSSRHHVVRPPQHRDAPAFAFVGAMEYAKGTFAFFDGNNDDYRKSLQLNGKIAGYTVQRITLGGVSLSTGSNTVFLAVGAQMRQSTDGTWEISDEPQDLSGPADSSAPAGVSDSSGGAAAPAASSGDVSDVLKRLMKLREQENK